MEVRLLGPLEVRRDGVPVRIGPRLERAALAILVLDAGSVVPADRLAELLWSGEPPPKAAAALHTKVAHLRRALEPDRVLRAGDSVLRTSPPGYRIAREDVDVDADRFESLVERARPLLGADDAHAVRLLEEALALWRGPALAEFAGEAFARVAAERLEALRLSAIELRAVATLQAGNVTRAVGQLQAHVARHPLREEARAQLARGLYLAGRQADALGVLHDGRVLLREELGVDPGPELRRIERQILGHDPALRPRQPAGDRPVRAPSTGLFGRGRECRLLAGAVTAARQGSGSVVLLTGDAGIGKSALLDFLAATARTAGGRVRSAICRDGLAGPPFRPVLQILREVAEELPEPERPRLARALGPLGGLLPGLVDAPAGTTGGVDPSLVLMHLADALGAALEPAQDGGGTPALVVLDDLQLADPGTLQVITGLAADAHRGPAIVALALRSGEGTDSAELTDVLAALGRVPRLLRLDLDPLAPESVAELVRARVGEDLDPRTVAAVVDRAGGNPFFAQELAEIAHTDGRSDPSSSPRGRPVGDVPAPVLDVLRQRFVRLPAEGLAVLTAAAVVGVPCTADELAGMTGLGSEEALTLLDVARRMRLVSDVGTARFVVAHSLIAEAVLASASSARLASLHRRFADGLAARSGADPAEAARIAHHYLAAAPLDGGAAALPWLERASDHAVQMSALAAVRELNEHVLAVLESGAAPAAAERSRAELRARGRIAYVDAWAAGYDSPTVREYCRLVRAWVTPEPALPTDVGLLWVAAMFECQLGRLDDADATVARMSGLTPQMADPVTAFLHADMSAVVRWMQGRFDEALEQLDRVDHVAGDDPVELHRYLAFSPTTRAAIVRAHCFWHLGRREEAFRQVDAALATASAVGLGAEGFARRWALLLALMDGDVERVRTLTSMRPRESSWERFRYPSAVVRFAEGWLAGRKDPAAGLAAMRAAHATLVDQGLIGGRSILLRLLAEAALAAGDPRAALAHCEAGLALTELGERYWTPELARLRAVAVEAAGVEAAGVEAGGVEAGGVSDRQAAGQPPGPT